MFAPPLPYLRISFSFRVTPHISRAPPVGARGRLWYPEPMLSFLPSWLLGSLSLFFLGWGELPGTLVRKVRKFAAE